MKKIKFVKSLRKPRLFRGYNINHAFHSLVCITHAVCEGMTWDEAFSLAHDFLNSEQEFVD